MALDDIFGTTNHVDWLQMCARAGLVFAYGVVMVRLSVRRVFGRWSSLDIVVAIIAGSNLSRTLTGSAPLWGTLAATTLMFVVHALLSLASAHWPWLSHLVEGHATVLGRDGTLDRAAVRRHGVSEAALGEALHGSGLTDASQTRLILLEPNGRISVLKQSS